MGYVSLCLDDKGVKEILLDIKRKTITYGLSRNCNLRADNITYAERSTSSDIFNNGDFIGKLKLNIPGLHNIRNALATVSVCLELGVDFETINQAISEFTGVYRRFEIKGEVNGITVIDDYAHHPTEIQATLQAARSSWNRRIVCVFQPHTYSKNFKFLQGLWKVFR